MIISLNTSGFYYEEKGDYDKALDYYNRASKVFGHKSMECESFLNIGVIYMIKDNLD